MAKSSVGFLRKLWVIWLVSVHVAVVVELVLLATSIPARIPAPGPNDPRMVLELPGGETVEGRAQEVQMVPPTTGHHYLLTPDAPPK